MTYIKAPEYHKNAKRFEREDRECANTKCRDHRGNPSKLSVYNDNKYCNKCLEDYNIDTSDNLSTSLKALQVENELEVGYAPMSKFSYLPRLKSVMREKGVKNTDLGATIGIHADRISGWRSCRIRCHPDIVKKIASALKVSVEDLK